MPELNLKELRKDLRIPELRLPEMSRDDIAKALGEARREIGEVRRDLHEFRREFEMPKVDLTKVDLSRVEMPKVDLSAVELPRMDMGKMGSSARKGARQAAERAGIVARRRSRLPFVILGVLTFGLVAWAMSSPALKARMRDAAERARERMAERRSAWDRDDDTHPFDVGSPATSPFSEPISSKDTPIASNGVIRPEVDQPTPA
jgi:hypothetical protein